MASMIIHGKRPRPNGGAQLDYNQRVTSGGPVRFGAFEFDSTSSGRWTIAAATLAVAAVGLALIVVSRDHVSARDRPRLAVLPFETDDSGLDASAKIIAEETLISLTELSAGRATVISGAAVAQYRGAARVFDRIKRDIDADYWIDGSLRRVGRGVRLHLKIARTRDFVLPWGADYVMTPEQFSEMHRGIAEGLARRLLVESRRRERIGSRSIEAELALVAGRAHLSANPPNVSAAVAEFQRAVGAAAADAEPRSELARAWMYRAVTDPNGRAEAESRARKEALKAVAMDRVSARAQAVIGYVRLRADWNWSAAREHLERALTINPELAEAHEWLAEMFSALGQADKALHHVELARDAAPLSPWLDAVLARTLVFAGRYPDAVSAADRSLTFYPAYAPALHWKLTALRASGGATRAQETVTREPFDRAVTCGQLGDRVCALRWLTAAVDGHDPAVIYLRVHPAFRTWIGDADFRALAARVGLPAAADPSQPLTDPR
jgi:tetratricopeptide (TPR) repeat protein